MKATDLMQYPGWLIVQAYREWSESYYAAGFYSPSPGVVRKFLQWCELESTREPTSYDLDLLNLINDAAEAV